jgi:hypothetical protein
MGADDVEPVQAAGAGPRAGFYARLEDAVARDAGNHARQAFRGKGRVEAHEALLGRSRAVLAAVAGALTPPAGKPRPWRHERHPMRRMLRGDPPYLDRGRLHAATAEYLALPFRSAWLDRLLVDLWVATEVYSFARGSRGVAKSGTPGQWLQGRVYAAAFYGMLALAALSLVRWGWISALVGQVLAATAAVLFAVETLLSLIPLVRQGRLFAMAARIYSSLGANGPLSAETVEGQVRAAAAAGLLWPRALNALLHDIRKRGGRF